jgi:biotin transport system substrate-specific component
VPIILQPAPLFFLSATIGWPAVLAFWFYLLNGALGAPFFAFGLGGFARLMGPTGGYLVGMAFAATFLSLTSKFWPTSRVVFLMRIVAALAIMYVAGLFQLSWFIPRARLFQAGFWPFMPGCIIKIGIIMIFFEGYRKSIVCR